MPAAYFHEVVARKVFSMIDSPDFIKKHMSAYLLGSQGPDPLFAHQKLNPFTKSLLPLLASRIHNSRVTEFIKSMVKNAKDNTVLSVYTLGYLTHYATDRIVHPYVYSVTENAVNKQKHAHDFLEAAFDTWLYRKSSLDGIPKRCGFLNELSREKQDRVTLLLLNCLNEVFEEHKANKYFIFDSIGDFNQIMKLMYSKDDKKLKFFQSIENILKKRGAFTSYFTPFILPGYDFTNASHSPWKAPWDLSRSYNYSLDELLILSCELSKSLIENVSNIWTNDASFNKLEAGINNINYKGQPARIYSDYFN